MPKFALISLVSDQPMPNVMAVLQREQPEQTEQGEQPDRRFTHLEFIVSADKNDPSKYDKRFDQLGKRLEAFFEKRGYIVSRRPPVDPYNLKNALKGCQDAVDALKKKGYEVVFNITGGTKIMSLAAYLCAQQKKLEAIYVESRDRFLISIPPSENLVNAIETDSLETERKSLQEELFREIDVPSYIALYGREIDTSIQFKDLGQEQINKARIIAQHYPVSRRCLKHLEDQIKEIYKRTGTVIWPVQVVLKDLTQLERDALKGLDASDILSWDPVQRILSCDEEQRRFLKGIWLEVFALDSLAASGLFHDVRGNVKIKDVGEWDVMLTVNAQLAIIECKSEAKLSDQFGKIRALQRDRGGLYGRSFFIRSGERLDAVHKLAEFYGIDRVIDAEDLPRLSEIIAQHMGVLPPDKTVIEKG